MNGERTTRKAYNGKALIVLQDHALCFGGGASANLLCTVLFTEQVCDELSTAFLIIFVPSVSKGDSPKSDKSFVLRGLSIMSTTTPP